MWFGFKPIQKDLSSFFNEENLSNLHLELTTRCKIACRRCDRTFVIGNHPYREAYPHMYQGPKINASNHFHPRKDMKLETVMRLVPKNAQFKVFVSGGYGDSIYHPQVLEILDYLIYATKVPQVDFTTNGSGMSEGFWLDFASLLQRDKKISEKKFRITFSIDGLEDTNHLYRRGSDWKSIMSALSILKGSARMSWKFIIFSHNQHQIEEAKRRSVDYGFDDISFVESNRHNWWWAGGDPELYLSQKDHENMGDPLKPTLNIENEVYK